ncbi:MAG: hypothetical protein Q7R44_00845 [bacterium]|nr:hypothetical protein [bacterium]
MSEIPHHKLHWRYKNLTLLTVGLIAGIFLYKSASFQEAVAGLGSFSYASAFLAGLLYDTTFTVSTSVAILLVLAKTMEHIPLVIVATFGAVVGDYIVFKFVKDGLMRELVPIEHALENEVGKGRMHYLKHLFHSRYFHWTLPVVAVIMIGTPLPNEVGIGLLGASGIKTKNLLIISFIFNFIGLNLVLLGSRLWPF